MATGRPEFPTQARAGRYVQQPGGYRAFLPAPLPPNPPVQLRGHLRKALSQADRALGRLDGSIQTLPNPDLFVFMYVRKEAVLSSQIEGTQSSLQDLLAAEAQILSPDRPRDVYEVVNYVRAVNYGLERLAELPVSVRLIQETTPNCWKACAVRTGGRESCAAARTGRDFGFPAASISLQRHRTQDGGQGGPGAATPRPGKTQAPSACDRSRRPSHL
jgi:hypothetical protein